MVKFEGGGATTELTQIGTRKMDEPTAYEDEDWDFSLSAPPGWYFYNKESEEETDKTTVRLINQDVALMSHLRLEKVPEEETDKTSRQAAESKIEEIKRLCSATG